MKHTRLLAASVVLSAWLAGVSACGGDGGGAAGTDQGGSPDVAAPDTGDAVPPDGGAADTSADLPGPPPDGGAVDASADQPGPPPDGGTGDVPANPDGGGGPGAPFTIAVLSDLTVLGNDFRSWNSRLDGAIARINAEPDVAFVLILGDLAASMRDPWHDEEPLPYEAGLQLSAEKLAALRVPAYALAGDKDYATLYQVRQFLVEWADPAEREALLAETLPDLYSEPGRLVTYNGVTFFLANTMAGPRAQENDGLTGSLGAAQLAALETLAEAPGPFVVVGHHPLLGLQEAPGDPTADAVLAAATGRLLSVFNGHLWSYADYDFHGVPGYAFHAVNESETHVAIVDIDPPAGTVTIRNRAELPFPLGLDEPACTPGENPVGPFADFVDSVHGLWVTDMEADDDIVAALLANADLGETPFAFHVLAEDAPGRYTVQAAKAANYHALMPEDPPVGGEHALMPDWDATTDPICEQETIAVADPCAATVDADIHFDVVSLADPEGAYGICNVGLYYDSAYDIQLRLGPDADGNLSFARGIIDVSIEKAAVAAAVQQFVVDAYCNASCLQEFYWDSPDEWAHCQPDADGNGAACTAGTLGFADVPEACNPAIGSLYDVPARFALQLLDTFPDGHVVHIRFAGFGHRMVLTDDMSQDWAVHPIVFDACYFAP